MSYKPSSGFIVLLVAVVIVAVLGSLPIVFDQVPLERQLFAESGVINVVETGDTSRYKKWWNDRGLTGTLSLVGAAGSKKLDEYNQPACVQKMYFYDGRWNDIVLFCQNSGGTRIYKFVDPKDGFVRI